MGKFHFGPGNPDQTYVSHSYPEHMIDLGEVVMNYSVVGDPALPALLLIPGQTESWWGYEQAIGSTGLAARLQALPILVRC